MTPKLAGKALTQSSCLDTSIRQPITPRTLPQGKLWDKRYAAGSPDIVKWYTTLLISFAVISFNQPFWSIPSSQIVLIPPETENAPKLAITVPKVAKDAQIALRPAEGRISPKKAIPIEGDKGQEYAKTLISQKAVEMGVPPEIALAIAKCEGDYNFLAKNKTSSAQGVYQIINSSWKHAEELLGRELDRKSWNDQISAGLILYKETPAHYSESSGCWDK